MNKTWNPAVAPHTLWFAEVEVKPGKQWSRRAEEGLIGSEETQTAVEQG